MKQEMNVMLCSYESCQKDSRCPDSFTRCMRGMMILVGIIGGILFATIAILLFINNLLPNVTGAALAILITGLAVLITVAAAALMLPCGSRAKSCLKCNTGGLFVGIIGTVLAGLIAVSADLTAVSTLAIVMVGLSAFFIAYLVVSILFLVICSTNCQE